MHLKLPKETKDLMVRKIQQYFYEEKGEEIGDLAAGNFLDFITKEMAPLFYNEGIQSAKVMMEQKMMGIEEDFESLKRPLHLNDRF